MQKKFLLSIWFYFGIDNIDIKFWSIFLAFGILHRVLLFDGLPLRGSRCANKSGAIIRSNFIVVVFSVFLHFSGWHCTSHVGVFFLYCGPYFTKQFLETQLRYSLIIEELFRIRHQSSMP